MWIVLWLACSGGDAQDAQSDRKDGTDSGTESSSDSGGESLDTSDTGGPAWPEEAVVLDAAKVVILGEVREAAFVLEGDRIWGLVESGQDWPMDYEVHDLSGQWVIPGLIDSHVHLSHGGATSWVGDTVEQNLRATLAWGVTGVVDAGGPEEIFALRDRIGAGELRGPRMVATGPFLTAEESHPCETRYDRDLCVFVDGDGQAQADQLASAGADFLKVALSDYQFTDWPGERLDLGDLADILGAGHPALTHVASGDDMADAVAAGAQNLVHTPFDAPLSASNASLPIDSIQSTISAFLGAEQIFVHGQPLTDSEYDFVPEAVRASWVTLQNNPELLLDGWLEANSDWLETLRQNLVVLKSASAPIVAGSDAGYYFVAHGFSLHRELEELVEAGWTEAEALAAATSTPADLWGWSDMGHVDAGYTADLVVLGGNPLSDIRNTQDIQALVLGGEWIEGSERATLPIRLSEGDSYCLADEDCPDACDLVTHQCTSGCGTAYTYAGVCDEDSWCAPQDGVSTTTEGVCHNVHTCSWADQDCAPEGYEESCVPADVDTSVCWPSGTRGFGESCSWVNSDYFCEPGYLCSWVNYQCYELCVPGEQSCTVGTCHQQYAAAGVPWFGLCW